MLFRLANKLHTGIGGFNQ